MKGDPLNPADWLRVAERDLADARDNLSPGKAHLAAYCLQQAAEKLLKGWLIGHGWTLVKTHALVRLAIECDRYGCDLAWFDATADRLSRLYFTDRYVDDSPDPDVDAAEIAGLLADVERLHTLLFPPPPAGFP